MIRHFGRVAAVLLSCLTLLALGEAIVDEAAESLALSAFLKSLLPAYRPVWPEMEFGWQLVVGSLVGFMGAGLGSVGGVGGGGIFVPMFTLLLGFDPKSSTALSKCMIMGAASSTVYYNLKMRHPTLNMPVIDYDLALLFQPMLMLGISIGVTFNVIFPDWLVTVLLIVLFLGTSSRAFIKGMDAWKKETILKKEVAQMLEASQKNDYKPLAGGPVVTTNIRMGVMDDASFKIFFPIKDLLLLLFVWLAFLGVQIMKIFSRKCSREYWILNALQLPISFSVTLYEASSLYRGRRVILSRGNQDVKWKIHQLVFYCFCGLLAGIVGGLLGLGGGFILGPLFLELGVPPQVASATSTFAMAFSSSMSVIQYYILGRFPVPYAIYFLILATVAALTGQTFIRRLIILLGRSSLIIFILAITIFVSAITLGGVGIANIIKKIVTEEYMGFESLCHH